GEAGGAHPDGQGSQRGWRRSGWGQPLVTATLGAARRGAGPGHSNAT
ncbi:hypothetical protein STIAU_6390, partial [Stigmatella aurantiaca DW4/3-1]